MTNEQIKNLALALAESDTESKVIKILRKFDLWDDKRAWKEIDQSSGNWSTIGNQQSSADTALVEKIINSVDAVLMRECLREGIQPDSDKAPKSIAEAQRKYFGIYNGKLSSLDNNTRARVAENIYLVATGAKAKPSYSIIDCGEGQNPDLFPRTFLSLSKSNKSKVQFVQGKFGMGGTGVFRFGSQEYNLQLIISKRDPKIEDSDGKWGVTVIRRNPPAGQERSSYFTYLVPAGKILSFTSKSVSLLPGKHPEAYSEPLEWGTFIKIYEYDIEGYKSNVRFDLYYRLSLLLPDIALPIVLCERRDYSDDDGKTKDMKIVMSGLSVRLDEDKRSNLEDDFPSSGELSVAGQKMFYSIYAFKKDKRRTYSGNEGIVFTVNGQAHGFLPQSFFIRQSVRMGYLSDSILIIVDCSNVDKRRQEDLFMNSRDRLSGGKLQNEIESQLADIIKNHQGLRALQEKRRREDIESKLQDAKPLADVIESLIKKSPSLASLFIEGFRIKNPFKLAGTTVIEKFKGRKFPSYFKLAKVHPRDNPKKYPINHDRFRIQYETDAENDYFDRDKEPGFFDIQLEGKAIQDYSLNLWNGIATLNLGLRPGFSIGDVVCFQTQVNDISRTEPFKDEFCIAIAQEQKETGGGGGSRKMPSNEDKGMQRNKPSSLALPNPIEVRREDWSKHNFDDKSAIRVVDAGEAAGYDFFINMDNVYLQMEIKEQGKKTDPRLLEARFKFAMLLLGVSLLNHEKQKKVKANDTSIYDKISEVSSAVAPTILPMISSLSELNVDEVVMVN